MKNLSVQKSTYLITQKLKDSLQTIFMYAQVLAQQKTLKLLWKQNYLSIMSFDSSIFETICIIVRITGNENIPGTIVDFN